MFAHWLSKIQQEPRAGRERGRFSRKTRSPSWTTASFWAAAATFIEGPAEGARSSSLFHWKAPQSVRAFADEWKALPRTFGSLGKVSFCCCCFCNSYMHNRISNKCPKAPGYNVFASSFKPRLRDSMGYTKRGNHLGHPHPSQGETQLGAGHSVTTAGQLHSPHMELRLFPTRPLSLLH